MPLLASNFTSNSLQGTVVVSGGWANVNLQVDAFAFEGNKSFVVKHIHNYLMPQVFFRLLHFSHILVLIFHILIFHQ